MRIRLNHQRLHELIAESTLSQNHWALKLGLSKGHWSGIVNGKHPYPSKKTQDLLVEAFEVPFEELFVYESRSGADAAFQAAIADRYLIEREIGQGGMGTVYLARDVKLARTVALKVISTEAVGGIGPETFLKEIRYTARLQHQNILPLFDAGEAAGAPYYVMPYIAPGSLRQLLERESVLPLTLVSNFVAGIAGALQHAHDHHVLHCDVKPENVLILGNHAFVADFGIARAIHAEAFEWGKRSELDTSAGTPAYVSPEQASGERNLDGRSDVFSLGCMVFEMLAGRPPFTGTSTMETVAKRFVTTPNLKHHAPHVSMTLASVIRSAMDIDPAERPESVEAFSEEFVRTASHHSPVIVERVSRSATRVLSTAHRIATGRMPRVSRFLVELWRDLQYAFRTFRKSPLFAVITILTLALGIGANTAVFTVVNGVLLRPLPYSNAEELAMVWTATPEATAPDTFTVSEADYVDWSTQSTTFREMAAFNVLLPTISNERGAERVNAGVATNNFFSLLGVSPILGTGFLPEHGTPGNENVVVLSYGFWQRWFGGVPDVLDQTLTVNGESYEIVGVMPPDYHHLDPSRNFGDAEFWAPIAFDAASASRHGFYLRVIGRLQSAASIDDAKAELAAIARQLEVAYPETNAGETAVVVSLRDQHYGNVRPALLLILAASGFVLLIVCANVGNLVLARTQSRRRELAVRTSLGAGRTRLARQLMVENAALALGGGALGLGMVLIGADLLRSFQGPFLSRVADIRVDASVIAFTTMLSLAVGVAFGLMPLVDVFKTDVRDVLSEDSNAGGTSRGTHLFRRTLVVVQVGIAVVLLTGTGLLTRSFLKLIATPAGFETQSTLTLEVTAPHYRYPEAEDEVRFFDNVKAQLGSLPGVEAIGLVSDLPFTTENRYSRFGFAERTDQAEELAQVEYRVIGPDYFRAMGIALLGGRALEPSDRDGTPPVAVINQEMVNRFAPGGSPIGRELVRVSSNGEVTRAQIVGVVASVLDDGFNSRPEPRVYFPYAQRPVPRMVAVLSTSVDPGSLASLAQQRVRQFDPQAPVGSVRTMRHVVEETLATERLAMRVATAFASLGLLLAAIGVYGLMAFVVTGRTRELGIRAALGADARDLMHLVLRQSLGLTVVGVLVGLVLAVGVARTLSSLLFGVAVYDPVSFLVPPIVLAFLALAASYLPARRATKIAPVEALRNQ